MPTPYVDERDPVEEFVQRIFAAPQVQQIFDRAGEMIDDAGRIFDPDFYAEAAAAAARRATRQAPRHPPPSGQAPPRRRPPPHQAPPPRPPPPPAPPRRTAREILHFDEGETLTREAIEQRRRDMAKIFHPDRQGGSTKAMQAINAAADELLADPRTPP